MDFMSTTQLLGNLGEFLGAIAVFITLIYLAVQVRHGREAVAANTKSLEENRRLALAQVYQGRSNQVQHICMLRAESDRWPFDDLFTPLRLAAFDFLQTVFLFTHRRLL